MVFSVGEIIDIAIMAVAIGYIFSTFIKREPLGGYDPLTYYKRNPLIEDIKYGIMIAAPAVVLHEIAHKFAAMAFGAFAQIKAPLSWYVFAIIMRLLNFPIVFFVGGYVVHTPLPPLESAIVAVSGPLVNLIFFAVCTAIIRFKLVKRKYYKSVEIMGKLNLFLFIFNILPLPGFDGFNVIRSVLAFFAPA